MLTDSMSTSPNRESTGLPALVTVEEAAAALRIGRTKAYAMAREWRTTGGRAGLPVVDLGHVLRVPLCQLEALIGGPLSSVDVDRTKGRIAKPKGASKSQARPSTPPSTAATPATVPTTSPRLRRRRAHQDQLDLFGPDPSTS